MNNFIEKYNLKGINSKLLDTALTHSSYANEHDTESYERLEFLGDSILEAVLSDYFYNNYNYKEGEMSKIRSKYTCTNALSTYIHNLHITPFIKLGNGMDTVNDSISEDVFESIVAVIYLSFDFAKAKDFIYKVIVPYIESNTDLFDDYKSILQELVQTDKKSLEYKLIKETGPAHEKEFTIEVLVDGLSFGQGVGKSKKEAEQNAAFMALKKQAKK